MRVFSSWGLGLWEVGRVWMCVDGVGCDGGVNFTIEIPRDKVKISHFPRIVGSNYTKELPLKNQSRQKF